ncbi:MAG: ABC transporter permease [Planctomycetes bacterium]|nr:ABC transporter permease [Planctomycetota bacterium]
MNMRRMWAVSRKEFLQVLRDPRSLGLAILMPVLLIVLFGYALTLDINRVPTIIWDQSMTPQSREYLSEFSSSEYFAIVEYTTNYETIQKYLDNGTALVGVVIPGDFASQLKSGKKTQVQIIVDGSDSTTAQVAISYALVVTSEYSKNILLDYAASKAIEPPVNPIELSQRFWFNQELKSRNFIIPGLIAMIMMIIAALLTSLTFSKEWETGTMEQLITTPVKGWELIVGKLIPYIIIGFIDVLLAVLTGVLVFDVPIKGIVFLVLLSTFIFLVAGLTQGMLISIVTKNQLTSNMFAMVTTFVPSFILSGFVFALKNMPDFLQYLSYAVSARYFNKLERTLFLKGLGFEYIAFEFVLLILFALFLLFLSNNRFKKRLN